MKDALAISVWFNCEIQLSKSARRPLTAVLTKGPRVALVFRRSTVSGISVAGVNG